MRLEEFKQKFKGDLVDPSSPEYKDAIARWASNAARRAALVAFVRSPEDVALALTYATSNNIPIAIKCGGHNPAGASSSEGGLVIDLSRHLANVRVDPEQKKAYIQGGAIWKTVDEACIKHGLATVGGTVNHTGVGGLITGGGYGWLSGDHGLAIDNMLEATVVTADGQILTASEDSHPDLFWGIRGGGSNFGVVTEFVQRLHAQRATVFAGPLIFGRDHVPAVANVAEEWLNNQSPKEGLLIILAKYKKYGPQPVLVLMLFYNGSEMEGREKFKTFFDLKPIAENCKEIPYETLNSISNADAEHGHTCWMGGALLDRPNKSLTLEVYDRIASYTDNELMIGFEFFPHHKINSIDPKATPYRRDLPGNTVINIRWEDEKAEDGGSKIWDNSGAPEAVKKIAKELVELSQTGSKGYANYDSEAAAPVGDSQNPNRTQKVFGSNYSRLQQVKAKYDPKCVFNRWFVVEPSTA